MNEVDEENKPKCHERKTNKRRVEEIQTAKNGISNKGIIGNIHWVAINLNYSSTNYIDKRYTEAKPATSNFMKYPFPISYYQIKCSFYNFLFVYSKMAQFSKYFVKILN